MKLSDKLETLLIMGAKMGGKTTPLSFVEEQMTGEEFDAAQAFWQWLEKTGKTFGHGNIQQVWNEFQRSLREGAGAEVENRTFTEVELHIAPDSTFVRRFGRKVKNAGGNYTSARGNSTCRFVYLSTEQTELINEIVLAYPALRSAFAKKGTPMITRHFEDNRFNRLPSWAHVHCYVSGDQRPMVFLLQAVDKAIDTAVKMGLVHDETVVKRVEESFGDLGTQVKPLPVPAHDKALLVEFGYKCCEKGMNIQATLEAFALMESEEPIKDPHIAFLKALAKSVTLKEQLEWADHDLLKAARAGLEVEQDEKKQQAYIAMIGELESKGAEIA